VARRYWKLIADFIRLECLAERFIRKLNSATHWGHYAWNPSNHQRWNPVGMEIPMVIRVR